MIKCLYGGPEFIYKVYPINNLTAKFLYDEGQSIVKAIESEKENKVIAVIADGHRTNQKCFSIWAMDSQFNSIQFNSILFAIKVLRFEILIEKVIAK